MEGQKDLEMEGQAGEKERRMREKERGQRGREERRVGFSMDEIMCVCRSFLLQAGVQGLAQQITALAEQTGGPQSSECRLNKYGLELISCVSHKHAHCPLIYRVQTRRLMGKVVPMCLQVIKTQTQKSRPLQSRLPKALFSHSCTGTGTQIPSSCTAAHIPQLHVTVAPICVCVYILFTEDTIHIHIFQSSSL